MVTRTWACTLAKSVAVILNAGPCTLTEVGPTFHTPILDWTFRMALSLPPPPSAVTMPNPVRVKMKPGPLSVAVVAVAVKVSAPLLPVKLAVSRTEPLRVTSVTRELNWMVSAVSTVAQPGLRACPEISVTTLPGGADGIVPVAVEVCQL